VRLRESGSNAALGGMYAIISGVRLGTYALYQIMAHNAPLCSNRRNAPTKCSSHTGPPPCQIPQGAAWQAAEIRSIRKSGPLFSTAWGNDLSVFPHSRRSRYRHTRNKFVTEWSFLAVIFNFVQHSFLEREEIWPARLIFIRHFYVQRGVAQFHRILGMCGLAILLRLHWPEPSLIR